MPSHAFSHGPGVSVLRVEGYQTTPNERTSPADGLGSSSNFSSSGGGHSNHHHNFGGDGKLVYRRVGGTACGGATFLGLAKLLTQRPDMSFDEALQLASQGDSANVDKV